MSKPHSQGRSIPNKVIPDLGPLPFDKKQPTLDEMRQRQRDARRQYLESRLKDVQVEIDLLDLAEGKKVPVKEEPVLVPVKKEAVAPQVIVVDQPAVEDNKAALFKNPMIKNSSVLNKAPSQPISNISKKTSSTRQDKK